MYSARFQDDYKEGFEKLEETVKERARRKIIRILNSPYKRHLKHGVDFFVDEIGQYRLTYKIFELQAEIHFYFIGNHKEYDAWLRQFD